jgi:hypothetical protein
MRPKTKRLAPAELCPLYASKSPHSLELDVRHSAREYSAKGLRTCALVILRHSEPYVTGSCCFGPASPSPLAFVLNIEPQRTIQQQLYLINKDRCPLETLCCIALYCSTSWRALPLSTFMVVFILQVAFQSARRRLRRFSFTSSETVAATSVPPQN